MNHPEYGFQFYCSKNPYIIIPSMVSNSIVLRIPLRLILWRVIVDSVDFYILSVESTCNFRCPNERKEERGGTHFSWLFDVLKCVGPFPYHQDDVHVSTHISNNLSQTYFHISSKKLCEFKLL
jgi:hypothetical protein